MLDIRSSNTDVLIVGAGPTGLVLALWLTRLGVRVRIVDKTAEPGTTSRALAVQARTLEFYQQMGLAETVVERGREVTAVNLWVQGKRAAHAVLGDMGSGMSPFAYALIFPQDEHERLLVARLQRSGREGGAADGAGELREEQGASAMGACGAAEAAGWNRGGMRRRLILPDVTGRIRSCAQKLGIGFPGGQYTHLFYVADVEGGGPVMNGELHVALDTNDFLAVFPLKGEGRARLVGTIRDDAGERPR